MFIVATVPQIQKVVAEYFNITLEQLLSPRRSREFSYPRMIAMSLSREITKLSYPQIAKFFNKDHTTVLHAVRWAKKNESVKEYVDAARSIIISQSHKF